ncbi:ABC transporter ATP-binding protein [Chryseotalea sanaruensis]|uniref:ABC transporter ATP-binding protein n=1 Tax=Chryseotalea sanaruensis TaxID=2482724 RepID=A0A401U9P1_9BACT|nr:ATP-binding cassette domain-containing protein [Chryseotalea sanaruensis]GCC51605.1 ABC transporter ATP-binding protein [Chryseotalea sanaruensis]
MIILSHIKKDYSSRTILNFAHLEIPEGIHWLKGGNGSGKTTLMKIIAGINPFDGEVSVDSVNLKSKPIAYRKLVSYAEAEPLFPEFLTGTELIRFVQQTRQASNQQVDDLLAHLDIADFIKYPVGTYSSGMLKKLSLLMTFIGDMKLILLDEPLITIDDEFMPKLLSLISQRCEAGVSFIISSHQQLPETHFVCKGVLKIENHSANFTLL